MKLFRPYRLHLDSQGLAKIFGDVEADIVELLWKRGKLSVRDVCEMLRSNSHPLSFNATMTILNRLVEKGMLKKERSDHGRGIFLYSTRSDRATFLKRMWQEIVRRIFIDAEPFNAAGFVDALETLPKKERQELTKLLSEQKKR